MGEGDRVPEVPAADVPREAYLLDVREDDEWQAGHAPDAQHIALFHHTGRVSNQIQRDRDVYVICRISRTLIRARRPGTKHDGWLSAQRRRRHARLGVRGTRHDQRIRRPAFCGLTLGPVAVNRKGADSRGRRQPSYPRGLGRCGRRSAWEASVDRVLDAVPDLEHQAMRGPFHFSGQPPRLVGITITMPTVVPVDH